MLPITESFRLKLKHQKTDVTTVNQAISGRGRVSPPMHMYVDMRGGG